HARSFAYWKVGVWDEKSNKPVWSDVSSFGIGLLTSSDWKGSYIGFPQEAGNPECPLIRKQFVVTGRAEKTFLHVNSLGYHEIYINGNKVGEDVLTPAVSQFDKRSQAVTYDLSTLLRNGRNDLIIWLGRGWYQPRLPGVVYEGPLVKAQLETLKGGAWNTLYYTDASWTCRESGSTGIGTWRAGRFGGEHVDAGKLLNDFTPSTLDASTWLAVKEIDVPQHTVSPMMTEPNRIQGNISPVQISPFGEDAWLIDMGKALTGWVEIQFPELKESQEIVMEYFDHMVDGKPARQGQSDRYIASGKKKEVFKNKFNYHSFQYIKISNLPTQPSLDQIQAYLIHTDYKGNSSFECSDPEMNAIHDMVKYTLQCLSLGGYIVDCSQIERLGYGGDGNASTQTAQIMFDLSPLYANWMQAWADCIREDGGMPHTAPNPYRAGGGPYWCGFIIMASWKTYINYGDTRLLEKYYPVMKHWFEYVDAYTVDGLLDRWPDTDYRNWYLGDWATPKGIDQTAKPSVDLVNNCSISECYATMEKIATLLGNTNDAALFSERKDQLRKLIHERFFDNDNNSYATSSQIDLAYPMLAQVTPQALVPHVTNTLYAKTAQQYNGNLMTGLVGIPVLTEWATINRSTNWVYGMLKKKDYPGYLYMIENGATATWEHWNGDRSRIHNCYNGIGSWFYEAIGGILPDEKNPGYKRVIIAPQVPDGITWAKATKDTPYGPLAIDWTLKENILSIDLTIPPGSSAVMELPANVNFYTIDDILFEKNASNEISSGKHRIVYRWE
ncbi:MAG: glycoside hydrolase family 78 protein, partial [Tannerella sp.]|nr:glycoside hydrolase family 78 protein [Tannerella sp.]